MPNDKLQYVLHIADDNLILGQRIGEWCGHGPVLEQDIALTNIALDLIGQARMLYQYAAEIAGGDATEDSIAMTRLEHEYLNVQLVEQPNGHFGATIMRQFLYDTYNYLNYKSLLKGTDAHLSAIAEKSLKEVTYHLRFSSEWVVRLGDGTEESRDKMQSALDDLWMFSGALTTPTEYEERFRKSINVVPLSDLKEAWSEKVSEVLRDATLKVPDAPYMQIGGKSGRHTEHMGFILSELQYMQRAFPNMQW